MKLATSQFLKENGYVVGKQQATTDGPPVLSHITMTKYTGGRACVPPAARRLFFEAVAKDIDNHMMLTMQETAPSGLLDALDAEWGVPPLFFDLDDHSLISDGKKPLWRDPVTNKVNDKKLMKDICLLLTCIVQFFPHATCKELTCMVEVACPTRHRAVNGSTDPAPVIPIITHGPGVHLIFPYLNLPMHEQRKIRYGIAMHMETFNKISDDISWLDIVDVDVKGLKMMYNISAKRCPTCGNDADKRRDCLSCDSEGYVFGNSIYKLWHVLNGEGEVDKDFEDRLSRDLVTTLELCSVSYGAPIISACYEAPMWLPLYIEQKDRVECNLSGKFESGIRRKIWKQDEDMMRVKGWTHADKSNALNATKDAKVYALVEKMIHNFSPKYTNLKVTRIIRRRQTGKFPPQLMVNVEGLNETNCITKFLSSDCAHTSSTISFIIRPTSIMQTCWSKKCDAYRHGPQKNEVSKAIKKPLNTLDRAALFGPSLPEERKTGEYNAIYRRPPLFNDMASRVQNRAQSLFNMASLQNKMNQFNKEPVRQLGKYEDPSNPALAKPSATTKPLSHPLKKQAMTKAKSTSSLASITAKAFTEESSTPIRLPSKVHQNVSTPVSRSVSQAITHKTHKTPAKTQAKTQEGQLLRDFGIRELTGSDIVDSVDMQLDITASDSQPAVIGSFMTMSKEAAIKMNKKQRPTINMAFVPKLP